MKPQRAPTPARKAAEPPVALRSASEWPANDCPRITVKTPTTLATRATAADSPSASWTVELSRKPGSTIARATAFTLDPPGLRRGREPYRRRPPRRDPRPRAHAHGGGARQRGGRRARSGPRHG